MTDQGNMRFPWYMKLLYALAVLAYPLRLLGRALAWPLRRRS